ncbi:MAG: hypothetical protein AAB444_01285 [Patescibacteria group bacterium]
MQQLVTPASRKGCGNRNQWRDYAINNATGEVVQFICNPPDEEEDDGSGGEVEEKSGHVTNHYYPPPTQNPPPSNDDDDDDDNPAPPTLSCDSSKMRVIYKTPGGAMESLTLRSLDGSFRKEIPGFNNFINIIVPGSDSFQIDRGQGKWVCNVWASGNRLDGELHVYKCVGGKEVEGIYTSQDTDPSPAYVGNCVRVD